MIILQTLK